MDSLLTSIVKRVVHDNDITGDLEKVDMSLLLLIKNLNNLVLMRVLEEKHSQYLMETVIDDLEQDHDIPRLIRESVRLLQKFIRRFEEHYSEFVDALGFTIVDIDFDVVKVDSYHDAYIIQQNQKEKCMVLNLPNSIHRGRSRNHFYIVKISAYLEDKINSMSILEYLQFLKGKYELSQKVERFIKTGTHG